MPPYGETIDDSTLGCSENKPRPPFLRHSTPLTPVTSQVNITGAQELRVDFFYDTRTSVTPFEEKCDDSVLAAVEISPSLMYSTTFTPIKSQVTITGEQELRVIFFYNTLTSVVPYEEKFDNRVLAQVEMSPLSNPTPVSSKISTPKSSTTISTDDFGKRDQSRTRVKPYHFAYLSSPMPYEKAGKTHVRAPVEMDSSPIFFTAP